MPNKLLAALSVLRGRKLRAIIYIRVSTAREEMASPEEQLFSCATYAKENGIEIAGKPVEDLDLSGKTFAKRQIASIIERVRNGEADIVLVWKWSRFGRNNAESQINLRALQEAGGELIASTEDIDTSTYHGKFSRDQMLLVAELQAGIIGSTWKDTAARRRRNQLPHTGAPRFGYMRCKECRRSEENSRNYVSCNTCKGVLQIDPKVGPALKEAYERYVWKGESIRSIALDMQKRGIRSIRGKIMPPASWLTAMDSGFAAGLLRGRSITDKKYYSNNKPESYDIWTQGKHEAIIDLTLWEAYKDKRANRAGPTFNRQPKHAFSGLAICMRIDKSGQTCRRKMSRTVMGQYRTEVFRCTGTNAGVCAGVSITLAKLDEIALGWLLERATDEDAGMLAMKRAAKVAAVNADIPNVESQITEKEEERKRLTDFALKGLVSEEDFRDRKEELEAGLDYLKARLLVLNSMVSAHRMPTAKDYSRLADLWQRMLPLEKRAALMQLVQRIEVIPTPGKAPNTARVVSLEEAVLEEAAANERRER
ncbi:hypothetical protein KNE206_63650 [Kitasatospora sp. NE20-6]|uniref:recombinase family protein n=1 Tax=Kitasatospora sp. NE20-6 TaxID=2859066 RepID=UPI0034DBBCAD